ncbi:MAG: putative baseplate assembly protein [Chloroflexi bacterium]|nr:putative baseplate assembly protein [Chloroflexota bacterium]
MLADESQIEVVWGDLRLRRDRNHQVTEAWVRWYSRDHLFLSGPNDRHFLLDRTHGRLIFGDGEHGKLPPQDAPILARMYRTGGGKAGNLPVQAISQLLAGIAGVESVFNVRPAEGGADTETLPAFAERGPQTLRGRGRALSPADYETLAREATPAVAVARAIPGLDPAGRRRPGWLTLLIIPHSQEPRPWPSFGLREQIRRAIEADAPAGLAAAHRIHVTGPDYLPVDVEATLAPVEVTAAGEVEHAARLALERFFHPLYGGPEGRGWALGRDVYLSDLAAVLEDVAGLDYVIELMLLREGIMQPGRVAVGDDQIVVAGDIRLKLIEAES